jgi:hypothetical protein
MAGSSHYHQNLLENLSWFLFHSKLPGPCSLVSETVAACTQAWYIYCLLTTWFLTLEGNLTVFTPLDPQKLNRTGHVDIPRSYLLILACRCLLRAIGNLTWPVTMASQHPVINIMEQHDALWQVRIILDHADIWHGPGESWGKGNCWPFQWRYCRWNYSFGCHYYHQIIR